MNFGAGRVIYNYRQGHHIDLKDFAKSINIDVQDLINIEAGIKKPDFKILYKVYKVSNEEFFFEAALGLVYKECYMPVCAQLIKEAEEELKQVQTE